MVDVIGYDENTKKFLLEYDQPPGAAVATENPVQKINRYSGRLNLTFLDFDSEEKLARRFSDA